MLNIGGVSGIIGRFVYRKGAAVSFKRAFVLSFLCLGGCAQTPFVDSRREAGYAGTVGESTPDRVAICYNTYSTNANEIFKMAQEVCAQTNREPAYDGQKKWSCRVFLPHRVYYRCQPKPAEETVER